MHAFMAQGVSGSLSDAMQQGAFYVCHQKGACRLDPKMDVNIKRIIGCKRV